MKKRVLLVLGLSLLVAPNVLRAEDAPAAPAQDTAAAPVQDAATAPAAAQPEVTPAPAGEAVIEPAAEPVISENLEFVSGEVSATDETSRKVTVKLYGETENDANDKLLSVSVDDATDITDGEKDRDLKSLAAGTEVDVEYDPATSKATYIFVY